MIAEGMVSGIVALPMEVTDVDKIAMLDGKPETRACRVGEADEIVRGSPSKLQRRTVGYANHDSSVQIRFEQVKGNRGHHRS